MKPIDELNGLLERTITGVQVRQLQTSLPGDDAGLWFIKHPSSSIEVSVESHDGEYPFLIESSGDDARITCSSVTEAIQYIVVALRVSKSSPVADDGSLSLESGAVRAWIEQESIHIIARESPSNDPVELTAASARQLAEALLAMAGKLHA